MIVAMIRGAALLSLAATLVLATGASATDVGAKPPDVTELFDQALATVRAQPDFAQAEVLEADGMPKGKKAVLSPRKIVRWRFVFQNSTPGSGFASATLNYRDGGFGRVVGHTEPFLEDAVIKAAPKMTLAEAVARLDRAGYDEGFSSVTLRSPLGPKAVPPLYIFTFPVGYVAVNTKNGKVRTLR
jgi:hypothetical protein